MDYFFNNESNDGCETPLAFIEPSKLVNDTGFLVPATWMDGTFSCLTPYVVSSDASGTEKNIFDLNEKVYCYAGNLPVNTEVKIYVVDNKDDWKAGNSLTDVSGGEENLTTNSSGGIWPPENIWSSQLTAGKYDIVVDIDQDGLLDKGEPIDSWATTGLDVIPEFPTIAIPVAIILLIMLLRLRRKYGYE